MHRQKGHFEPAAEKGRQNRRGPKLAENGPAYPHHYPQSGDVRMLHESGAVYVPYQQQHVGHVIPPSRGGFHQHRGGRYMEYHGTPSPLMDFAPQQLPFVGYESYENAEFYGQGPSPYYNNQFYPAAHHNYHYDARMNYPPMQGGLDEYLFESGREVHRHGVGLQVTVENNIAKSRQRQKHPGLGQQQPYSEMYAAPPEHFVGNNLRLPAPPNHQQQFRRGKRGGGSGRGAPAERPPSTSESSDKGDVKKVHFESHEAGEGGRGRGRGRGKPSTSRGPPGQDEKTQVDTTGPTSGGHNSRPEPRRGGGGGGTGRGGPRRHFSTGRINTRPAEITLTSDNDADTKSGKSNQPANAGKKGKPNTNTGKNNAAAKAGKQRQEVKNSTGEDSAQLPSPQQNDSRRVLTLTHPIALDLEELPPSAGAAIDCDKGQETHEDDLEMPEFEEIGTDDTSHGTRDSHQDLTEASGSAEIVTPHESQHQDVQEVKEVPLETPTDEKPSESQQQPDHTADGEKPSESEEHVQTVTITEANEKAPEPHQEDGGDSPQKTDDNSPGNVSSVEVAPV